LLRLFWGLEGVVRDGGVKERKRKVIPGKPLFDGEL
jgi:hypothetical protein